MTGPAEVRPSEPAADPEPADPEEVCPEFTHTGYCPDRLCERGCKHEPAWKIGDRVEHTIHGTGTVVRHDKVWATVCPYEVRFDSGDYHWVEAGDIQEAPPVSEPQRLANAPGWAKSGSLYSTAPPVSDTVMVSDEELGRIAARAWGDHFQEWGDGSTLDAYWIAVAVAVRAALTAEGERA